MFLIRPGFSNQYKKIIHFNGQEVGNMLFSTSPLERSGKKEVEIRSQFYKGESVFAVCYYPFCIGKVRADEFCFKRLYLDDKLIAHGTCSNHPIPGSDREQFWIYKTGDDDLSMVDHFLDGLAPGSYYIKALTGYFQYVNQKESYLPDGTVKREKKFSPVYLSLDHFRFIVP